MKCYTLKISLNSLSSMSASIYLQDWSLNEDVKKMAEDFSEIIISFLELFLFKNRLVIRTICLALML